MKDKDRNPGPFGLMDLVDKAKPWRVAASKMLIEQYYEIKSLKREVYAVLGLTIAILGVLIKLAIGG